MTCRRRVTWQSKHGFAARAGALQLFARGLATRARFLPRAPLVALGLRVLGFASGPAPGSGSSCPGGSVPAARAQLSQVPRQRAESNCSPR